MLRGAFFFCLRLSDDVVGLEVVTISDGELDLEVPSRGTLDTIIGELLLPRECPRSIVIIFGKNDEPRVLLRYTGDDIAPSLIIVDTNGEGEDLVTGLESKQARGARAIHGKDVGVIHLRPGTAIGKVPDALFDDLEKGVGVGAEDFQLDRVRHAERY
jgi:hypothetical protein